MDSTSCVAPQMTDITPTKRIFAATKCCSAPRNMDIELEQIALLQAWYLHKSRTALAEGTSMPQYGLIGDSSLYRLESPMRPH